jgi:hypothetical protein
MKAVRAAFTLAAIVGLLAACAPQAAAPAPQAAEPTAVPPTEAPAEPTAVPATETPVPPEPTPEPAGMAGEVVVSLQGQDTQTWQALCDAYVAKNPAAKCSVELKPSEGYQDWIRAQFAAGEPRPSLVNMNVVGDLANAKKFVNLEDYMDKANPYNADKPWRDSFDQSVMALSRDPVTGELYHLSLEMVKILWFYNKDIADQIGVTKPPETWDEMADMMAKAAAAGFIPFSIGGDFQEFWEMRIGWLARMYQDGFYCAPEKWELSRCQEGDWCYEVGVDDTFPAANWQEDRHFDDAGKVHQNWVRWLNAFQEGKIGPKDAEYKALMQEFKKVFKPENLPPGWTGVNGTSAYALFLSGKALFWLDGGWTIANIERDLNKLRTGTFFTAKEGEPTPTPDPAYAGVKSFPFVTFDNPKMTAPEATCPWQRTIEWPVGFWGIPVKNQAQNDLELDFMMFVTSPEGYKIYLDNKIDANNPNGGLTGPFIVKGLEMPPELASKFENLKPVGNTEKTTAGSAFSRGLADYQPMVREWVSLAQQYFTDKIDLDTYITKYDEVLRKPDLWAGLLEHSKLTEEDLKTPEKKPPER